MDEEERFLDAVDDDEEVPVVTDWRERKRRRLRVKNQVAIDGFLGEGRRTSAVGIEYWSDITICILPIGEIRHNAD